MNNYYTLIYVIREIGNSIEGAIFDRAITPFKNVLELYFENQEQRFRIICNTSPSETAFFYDHYRPPKKSNVLEFFEKLKDKKCAGISMAENDRLVYLNFNDGSKLLFRLFGSANAHLVEKGTIVSSFKKPDTHNGNQEPVPKPPKFSDTIRPNASPKNKILQRNPLLPRPLVSEIIKYYDVDAMDQEKVIKFVDQLTQQLHDAPRPRVLTTGHLCLWGYDTLPIEALHESDSVNDCVNYAYKKTVRERRLHKERSEWEEKITNRITKLEAELNQLNDAEKSLERADKYEKWGHLLMAHAHLTPKDGEQEIEVTDWYSNNQSLRIPIKPESDIASNAEAYYDKASDARKNYNYALKRREEAQNQLQKLKELYKSITQFEYSGDVRRWLKDHEAELKRLGIQSKGGKTNISRPYRVFHFRNYEIWVGKSAKSNDELLSSAHKEDIWLHARGVTGSHVVIRMDNHKKLPPQMVLEAAAAMAAYYSKASGSSIAPVQYAKRKYINKPKGAAPGQVTLQHEEVIMANPVNPEELVKHE